MEQILIFTTCRPAKNMSEFLTLNPIVSQCLDEKIKIFLYNKSNELPAELASYELIGIRSHFSGSRPNLSDMLKGERNSNILLCNSDIFFEYGFLSKIRKLLLKYDYSYSGRRHDLHSNLNYSKKYCCKKLLQFGQLQSSRTLDYFIINKKDLNICRALKNLKLGMVGFDIHLASALNNEKRLVDATYFLNVFHRNHEEFREIYKTSILLSKQVAKEFVHSRAKSSIVKSKATIKGDLSYCVKHLDKNGEVKTKFLNKKFIYYYQKLITKVSNKVEGFCFNINELLFRVYARELNIYVISRLFKVVICLPVGEKTTSSFKQNVFLFCENRLK